MIELNKKNWNQRYIDSETGWDVGYITDPIKEYFDQINDKKLKILIPGSGNGYEAEYLYRKGFENVFVLDYAKKALKNFKNRVPDFPKSNILEMDFFDLNDSFDIILEQTFFCALDIDKRNSYINKTHFLLKNRGKLVGVFFDDKFANLNPPFGANLSEYKSLLGSVFHLLTFENCYNSISSRKKNEFFCIAQKK